MTFFSCEEHIKEWEQEHPEFKGSTIGMDQGLGFILTVGGTRGDYNYFPITLNERDQALERCGLAGDFWKPRE